MPSVASTHPLWGTTLRSLRDLTRLAVTALALAVGLSGPAAVAAPAPPAQVVHVVGADRAATARVDDGAPAGQAAERLGVRSPAVPATDLRSVATATATVAVATDVPADEPARTALTRRGPPRA